MLKILNFSPLLVILVASSCQVKSCKYLALEMTDINNFLKYETIDYHCQAIYFDYFHYYDFNDDTKIVLGLLAQSEFSEINEEKLLNFSGEEDQELKCVRVSVSRKNADTLYVLDLLNNYKFCSIWMNLLEDKYMILLRNHYQID